MFFSLSSRGSFHLSLTALFHSRSGLLSPLVLYRNELGVCRDVDPSSPGHQTFLDLGVLGLPAPLRPRRSHDFTV